MDKPGGESGEAPESQVWVTYLFTSIRCPTCKKLEAYSRQAIEEGFPAELEEKRVVFRTLNLDEPGNSRYVEAYKLVTKSLIVSLNRKGKEIKWKNLPDIWKLVGDQEKFTEYVQRETRSFLEELGMPFILSVAS
ncbi:MAG: nitrophenyl compound nitroreductase subunit ArsF family protein, partial [Thermodesulfobacteriota bacterium]